MIWHVECKPALHLAPEDPGGDEWVPAIWHYDEEKQFASFTSEDAARAYEASLRLWNAFQALGPRDFRTRPEEDPVPLLVLPSGRRIGV